MFTLSFGKLLVVVLVVVAAWRGYRLLQQIQARLAATDQRRAAAAGPTRSQATDLVECPRCGLLVPNGTTCRSVKECRFRSA
jgi:hypothetical protein